MSGNRISRTETGSPAGRGGLKDAAPGTARSRIARWGLRTMAALAVAAVALPQAVPAAALELGAPVLNGTPTRYATPMAVVAFTGQEAGAYYYRVADAGADAPSPEDLLAEPTGTGVLRAGANTLILKGAQEGMDSPGAKTVYLAARPGSSGPLSDVTAAQVPAAGTPVAVRDDTTVNGTAKASALVSVVATGPETYKIASGLVDAPSVVDGSALGRWSELNGLDGLRFDTDPILVDQLSQYRAIAVSGASKDFSAPLRLTVKDVNLTQAAAGTTSVAGVSGLSVKDRAHVVLDVQGSNTMTSTGLNTPGIHVPDAANSNSGRLEITSHTGGQLTTSAATRAAGIGGSYKEGGGYIIIDGNVRVVATGGAGSTSASPPGGTGIGGGGGGAMGQITIGGQARVWAKTGTNPFAAAIGASSMGANSFIGDANNWVHIKDQATVVAAVDSSNTYSPAIGVDQTSTVGGAVKITGGLVVSYVKSITYPAISSDSKHKVLITGGSVVAVGSTKGTNGVLAPVDAQGTALFPAYVPAATADGVDLTDQDIDFANADPLHTLTAAQLDWVTRSGSYFPGPPVSVPLTDAGQIANNTLRMAGQAWLPAGLNATVRAGQGPDYTDAKALAVDVRNSAPVFAGATTNTVGVPVSLSVAADGAPNTQTSTQLELTLSPPAPGLTVGDIQFTPVTGQVAPVGELITVDGGATYTVGLSPEIAQGTVRAVVASHGYTTMADAQFAVNYSDQVDLTPLDKGVGRRFFTSVMGGAHFSSSRAGVMYYQYGGDKPDSAEDLKGSGAPTAPVVVGRNTVPALIDETLAASDKVTCYVTVHGNNGALSDVIEFTIPAYAGNQDWFALPGDTASPTVTQTVQPNGTQYRLTGLTGDLEAVNNRDLTLASAPVELGAAFSGTRSYTLDANMGAGPSVPLRLNGVALTAPADSPAVKVTGAGTAEISVDGQNTLTGTAHAGLAVPTGVHVRLTSTTRGRLSATGVTYGAGIGGWNKQASGEIEIVGNVQVVAQANLGAAVGGGYSAANGPIVIGGEATVTATTSKASSTSEIAGAAIGAGHSGKSGAITIHENATVTATTTGTYAAGIGSGGTSPEGPIVIGGDATVEASAHMGAGIGAGQTASGKSVWIGDKATVKATSNNGAGIGGGYGSYAGGAGGIITITDSAAVTATGSAGIGGAYWRSAMGQITISGHAKVAASGAGAAIGGGGTAGAGDNDFVRITGSPTVVAYGYHGAIGGGADPDKNYGTVAGSVFIEGGFVSAEAGNAKCAVGNVLGKVAITGGSLNTHSVVKGSNCGVRLVQDPVDEQDRPVYPAHIPAATADGVDLTDSDVEFGGYSLHTVTADQKAWADASYRGWRFPYPSMPLADASDPANNAELVAGTAWLPEGLYTSGRAGQGPGFAGAKTLAADVRAEGPEFDVAMTNVAAIPVELSAQVDGKESQESSTELRLGLAPAAPGLTSAGVELSDGTGHAALEGEMATTDGGATYTVDLDPETVQGTVLARVASHTHVSVAPAGFAVHRDPTMAVSPVDGGRRLFASVVGGPRFRATWAGTMYYRYG
ncbi:MAG: hypothetical protein LBJ08_09525, partial [Bifidobacteriaceae bacterium]|nr:hypothetical protein [Bifidobacteriaceae bacterium]